MLRLNFLANRYQFFFLRLHQTDSMKKRFGPCFDAPDIVGVGTHLLADHQQRQRDCELFHPFALAVIDKVIN